MPLDQPPLSHLISEASCSQPPPSEVMWLIFRMLAGMVSFSGEGGNQIAFLASGQSFSLPPFDSQGYTYHGSTNNIHEQKFYQGGLSGTLVATLTYLYVGGAVSDDDKILSVIKS